MSGSDILREVEESIRIEKAARVWKEHGKTIMLVLALILIGTAAQSIWIAYKNKQNASVTSLYISALKGNNKIADLQKLGDSSHGNNSSLATLTAAALSVEKQEWENSILLYGQVANDKSAPSLYRDLAIVQLSVIKLDHDKKTSQIDLLKLIAPVIKDKKSPWYIRAIFTSALIKANYGDIKDARSDLGIILSYPNIPENFLEQVKALDEVYKIKQGVVK